MTIIVNEGYCDDTVNQETLFRQEPTLCQGKFFALLKLKKYVILSFDAVARVVVKLGVEMPDTTAMKLEGLKFLNHYLTQIKGSRTEDMTKIPFSDLF